MAKEPLLYTMAVVLPLAYLLSNSLCTILGVNGVLGDCLICLTSIIITYIMI